MHLLVFIVCAVMTFYAILAGRPDSAFQLSGLALVTFILAGIARR